MKDSSNNISKIISKYLMGELNEKEQDTLDRWLENPDNAKQFHQMTAVDTVLERMEQYDKNRFDADKAYAKVIRGMHSNRRWLSYAAAILLPLAIAVGIYIGSSQEQPSVVVAQSGTQQVQPKAPILITDEGEYALGEADTTFTIGNTQLVSDQNQLSYQKESDQPQAEAEKLVYNTIKTPKGVKYRVVLGDGTTVWLNSETELRYPVNFSSANREVFVKGEAYFDVAKEANKPFLVHFDDRQIRVLGTKFNVESYQGEQNDWVTLEEGAIQLTAENKELKLSPNKQAVIDNARGSLEMKTVDASVYSAWKDQVYLYKGATLRTIINDFERDFDIHVSCEEEAVLQEKFSLKISSRLSFEAIFSALEKTNELEIEIENNHVIIRKK